MKLYRFRWKLLNTVELDGDLEFGRDECFPKFIRKTFIGCESELPNLNCRIRAVQIKANENARIGAPATELSCNRAAYPNC